MAQNPKEFEVPITVNGDITSASAITASGNLRSTNSSGDEGGEIFLNKAVTNTTLTGGVTIDVFQDKLRFFEQGGSARGYYIDITGGGAGVSTNLVGGGGGSASNSFATISTPSGTSPVADSSTDTLTLTAGTGITITGDSSADSVAIATNGATANGASTLVLRDSSGNFAANQATLVSQKFGLGAGAPTFNSYSGGVRTIYYDNIGAASAGYTVGINSGEFWHTTSDTTGSFKWYGGVTLAATLTGTGAFTAVGDIAAATFSGSGASLTNIPGANVTGTLTSTVLGNSTAYVGTTAVALNRASANQGLTGISSVTFPGSTSGTIQLLASATAGTGTVVTLPATTGTVVTTGDTGSVTNTMLSGSIANAKLANTAVLLGAQTLTLGAAATTTISGMTSVSSSTLTSTVASGTAPLTISSPTVVTNLAANYAIRGAIIGNTAPTTATVNNMARIYVSNTTPVDSPLVAGDIWISF